MRSKPKLTYKGLTVVLSNPSRFDIKCNDLLSANGGLFFQSCLRPEFNRAQCDIRIKEDKSPLLEGTKCVLLLGEEAMHTWLPELKSNTLGQCRGSVYAYQGVPCISSFYPQDCALQEMKDYEAQYNPYDANYGSGSDDKEGEQDEKSSHGNTRRKNYAFWLSSDIDRKVKPILNGLPIPKSISEYKIRPPSAELIHELTTTKDQYFYLDIETDISRNILCFAYAFNGGPISVVPFVNHNYDWAYHNLHLIWGAIGCALRANVAVAHNGYGFDFLLLAHKYKLPICKAEDTLIANHRIFPDVEKSLGHCMSFWTWEPYHKDESDWSYRNPDACIKLWKYCGKDIHGLRLVHQAQKAYAKRIPGLTASIDLGNRAIKPYITTMLQGIKYDQSIIEKTMKENDRLMLHYVKMINVLVGDLTVNKLKARFKSSLPASNPQCVEYFHKMLDYEVVGHCKEKEDGSRNPSLGKENIFKLKSTLKKEGVVNPVLDFVIAYRELQTESGYLKFLPWVGDNQYYIP